MFAMGTAIHTLFPQTQTGRNRLMLLVRKRRLDLTRNGAQQKDAVDHLTTPRDPGIYAWGGIGVGRAGLDAQASNNLPPRHPSPRWARGMQSGSPGIYAWGGRPLMTHPTHPFSP